LILATFSIFRRG